MQTPWPGWEVASASAAFVVTSSTALREAMPVSASVGMRIVRLGTEFFGGVLPRFPEGYRQVHVRLKDEVERSRLSGGV